MHVCSFVDSGRHVTTGITLINLLEVQRGLVITKEGTQQIVIFTVLSFAVNMSNRIQQANQ